MASTVMSLNFRVIQIIQWNWFKTMHPRQPPRQPMQLEYNFATSWNSTPESIIKRSLLLTTETMWSRPLSGALRWSCICVDLTFQTENNDQWTDTRWYTLRHSPKKPDLLIFCLQQQDRLALVLISEVLSKTNLIGIIQKGHCFQGCGIWNFILLDILEETPTYKWAPYILPSVSPQTTNMRKQCWQ